MFSVYVYWLFCCRSPDTVSDAETHDVESQFVWRGEFSMHGMAKFAACAYTVSGPVEYLDEV